LSKKYAIIIILFILTAILHILQLSFHGVNNTTIGNAVFGLMYLLCGFLLFRKKRWKLIFSIVLPAIGLLVGIVGYFKYSMNPSFFPILILIDIIIIILCYQELKNK
jgi:hypothetical protein